MASRGAAATLALHLMVVATLTLAAATFMSTAEAGCSSSMAQNFKVSNTSGRFRVPEGGEDGVYMGSVEVDEQGVEQYRVKFLGAGNTTLHGSWANNNVNVSRAGGLGRKLLQDSGAHCQFNLLDPSEVYNAHDKVANYFGRDGDTMPANFAWFASDGCTVAYICNYNNVGLFTTSLRIWRDAVEINNACGADSGGYCAREYTSNSASGRTYVGNTFC